MRLWQVIVFMVMASFIVGMLSVTDNDVDKLEQATKADRLRVYCAMPGHFANLCPSDVQRLLKASK